MDQARIGIKQADGSFVPILDEGAAARKKLTLTTIRDNQESVQIDLYRGIGEDFQEPQYVGSLQIENIQNASKGEPEVELVLGVDDEGNLSADASDSMTGERQSLSLTLESLDESQIQAFPDFQIDSDLEQPEEEAGGSEELGDLELPEEDFGLPEEEPGGAEEEAGGSEELGDLGLPEEDFGLPEEEAGGAEEEAGGSEELGDLELPEEDFGLPEEETAAAGAGAGDDFEEFFDEEEYRQEELRPEEQEKEPKAKKRPLVLVGFIVFAIVVILLATLLLFRAFKGPEVPPLEAEGTPQTEQAGGVSAAGEEPEAVETEEEIEEATQPEQSAPEEAAPEETAPEEAAPEEAAPEETAPEEAVASSAGGAEVEETESPRAVEYRIRRGDTLWDLSEAFYRTPWLYGKIAEYNNIEDPDYIQAGNRIRIPE